MPVGTTRHPEAPWLSITDGYNRREAPDVQVLAGFIEGESVGVGARDSALPQAILEPVPVVETIDF